MSDTEVEIVLKHLSVLNLKPDDQLVLSCTGYMSDKAYERLRDGVRSVFGEKRRILILENGITLGAVRSDP